MIVDVATRAPVARRKIEALVWKHVHRDFRDTRDDGTRVVLIHRPAKGTCSEAIASLSERDLLHVLPRTVADRFTIAE